RDLHGRGREDALEALPAVVGDVADAAEAAADDDEVAELQLAVLHDDVGDWAPALFHACFEDGAAGLAAEVGLEFEHLALEVEDLEERVDALPGVSAGLDDLDVAAPRDGVDALLGELAVGPLDAFLRDVGLVDLVER